MKFISEMIFLAKYKLLFKFKLSVILYIHILATGFKLRTEDGQLDVSHEGYGPSTRSIIITVRHFFFIIFIIICYYRKLLSSASVSAYCFKFICSVVCLSVFLSHLFS